jgi:hypothetical protein
MFVTQNSSEKEEEKKTENEIKSAEKIPRNYHLNGLYLKITYDISLCLIIWLIWGFCHNSGQTTTPVRGTKHCGQTTTLVKSDDTLWSNNYTSQE